MDFKKALPAGDFVMNLIIERPSAFYFLLLLVPALVFVIVRYKKLLKCLGMTTDNFGKKSAVVNYTKRFMAKTICRALAVICLVASYAGIFWGTKLVPVKKSGNAVAFVFDISYSMQADDAAGNMSRLNSAAHYAEELLKYMERTSVSVILTKGEGVVAIPLTEDFTSIQTLLSMLSPKLMTTIGTNLGNGIETAIKSFPEQSSMASRIWVFTDGDEPSSNYIPALEHSVKCGIPVTLIGFGSERETEIVTGDGITKVKTALRSAQLENTVSILNRNSIAKGRHEPLLNYIDASEYGSGFEILKQLKGTSKSSANEETLAEESFVAYEEQPVERKNLFLLLAIVFYIISFVSSELTFAKKPAERQKATSLLIVLSVMLLFTGCSSRLENGISILKGKMAWNRKNYQEAVACFLEAAESAHERGDFEYEQYALYDLASTYLMENETDAALERFEQIAEDVPEGVRFAVMYNSGIIAHRKGDYEKAAVCFKDALQIDSTNTNAKINLELSLMNNTKPDNAKESELTPLSQNEKDKTMKDAIYSIIKENEQNRWKNQRQEQQSSSKDY